VNNPPVGLVTPETNQDKPAKKYAYDPQLVWAGKAERTSFKVPTVSLHAVSITRPYVKGNGHNAAGLQGGALYKYVTGSGGGRRRWVLGRISVECTFPHSYR
jgi:hypothetical protein